MSDTNQGQFKQKFLMVLVLLLVLFAGIQTWYMVGMKKQLDVIHTQQSSTRLQEQDTTAIEKNIVETDNAAEPAGSLQSSLQEKEVETLVQKPAEKPDENITPDKTPALSHDETFNIPFKTQARNPYDEIQRRQHEMDRRFNQRFNRFTNKPDFQYHFSQSLSTPKIDVRENANQYTVIMNLPDADESDISVNLDGQRLTIKGKQEYKKQNRDATGNMIFRARQSARFQRSITLANPVIQNKMKQRLDNGVLVIIIPKVKYEQRR